MRAVLDCNVIASGLISAGKPPALVLKALVDGRFEAVLSPNILEEYRRILHSPKLRRYIPLPSNDIEALLTSLALTAFGVEDQETSTPIVTEDPSDDIYILAALEGEANSIVSGDRHLLDLQSHQGIPILSPRDFLQVIK